MYKFARGIFFSAMANFVIVAFAAAHPVSAQDVKASIEKRQLTMKEFGEHFKAISAFLKLGEGSAEDIAKRAGEFILINHFISMVDALFLSKISNSNNLMTLYMNVNPNLYNYGGLGSLNIRMEWK